jgi:hypothetical protein
MNDHPQITQITQIGITQIQFRLTYSTRKPLILAQPDAYLAPRLAGGGGRRGLR